MRGVVFGELESPGARILQVRPRLRAFTDSGSGICLAAVRLLLVVLTIAVIAGGYASPVDPSWIPGYYDDADHDDVVILVTEGQALSSNVATTALPMPSVELQSCTGAPRASRRLMLLQDERGPPACFETLAS